MLKIILLGLTVSSCVGPSKWRPEQHFEAMQHCKIMCGEKMVKEYVPFSAQCSCKEQ